MSVEPDMWGHVGSRRREEFEELYRAQVRSLLAYALRRVDHPEQAADAVAETMLVAWRRLDQVPPGDEARLWLFGVARRVLASQRRGSARRDRLGERLRDQLRGVVGPDHAGTVAADVTVRAALDVLGEDDREILRLATWEDLDPREIASVLGIPSPTARSRLHRARQRLRRILDDDSDNGSGERPCSTGHVDHDEQALVRDAKDDR